MPGAAVTVTDSWPSTVTGDPSSVSETVLVTGEVPPSQAMVNVSLSPEKQLSFPVVLAVTEILSSPPSPGCSEASGVGETVGDDGSRRGGGGGRRGGR